MSCRTCLQRFLVATALLVGTLNAAHAAATPPPWLKAETVPSEVWGAVDQMHVEGQLTHTPATYDSTTQRWSFSIVPATGPRVDITIDENTGDVCARHPGEDHCGGTSTVKPLIDQAKAEFARREDARLNPAPDLDGLRLMLIRRTQEGTTRPETWYVALEDTDGKHVDPSPGFLARASSAMITLVPISTMPEPRSDQFLTRVIISQPLRRPDGDYDVSYGVWSSSANWMGGTGTNLRMSHDASGWHVVAVLGRDMI
jgi:hypothetical protein